MNVPGYWHFAKITQSGTPELFPNETVYQLLDFVGLYQGDFKVLNRQNGRIYLTSKRLIYIDNQDAINNSIFLYIEHIKNLEFYSGFLKSLPKLTVELKSELQDVEGSGEEPEVSQWELASWKCKICSFTNQISPKDYDFSIMVNNDLNQALAWPKCSNCGVKGNKNTIINAIKKRRKTKETSNVCSACTFENHKLMLNCEMCNSPLKHTNLTGVTFSKITQPKNSNLIFFTTEGDSNKVAVKSNFIKLSFRNVNNVNDLKRLLTRLQQSIDDLAIQKVKQSSHNNQNVKKIVIQEQKNNKFQAGIASLEKKQDKLIEKNQQILGSSLEDLDSLMSKAKELNNLIKSFDKILNSSSHIDPKYAQALTESKHSLGINSNNESLKRIVINNNFNFLNKLDNKQLFYKELARNLSVFVLNYVFVGGEYLGGIISLIDLYALYNRSLGFNNNLISPSDILEAASLFETLKLPLVFRKFPKSGLMVVQNKDNSDEKVLNSVLESLILRKFQLQGLAEEQNQSVSYDLANSRGTSIHELSKQFQLTIGILKEILSLGLKDGSLLIDESITGVSYYLNEIKDYKYET